LSGGHGACADKRFSCRMIMRSLNATVPLRFVGAGCTDITEDGSDGWDVITA
jgi:hypothetical protein